jgi:uncharacterized membrane protein YkoI
MIRTFFVSAFLVLAALVAMPALAQNRATLSEDDARRIALQHVPNGTVEEIELDDDESPPVYEVEVVDPDGREHELEIDATNGRVIRAEVDDD